MKDSTSWMDSLIQESAREYVDLIRNQGPQVLNRPMMQTKTKSEDQLADWQMTIGDPQQLAKRFLTRSKVIGKERAMLEIAQWDAEMRKLASRNGGE